MNVTKRLINILIITGFLFGCNPVNTTENQPSDPSQFPRICERYSAPQNYSPDGLWMAELCYNEDDKGLILTISNKETRDLWKLIYRDYIPPMKFLPDGGMATAHWSNDGKYAYFYSYANSSGGGCFVPYSLGGWGLFRLELKTGNVISILPIGNNEYTWYGFSFSPTNKHLVYGVNAKNFFILDMRTDKSLNINHQNSFDDGGGFLWSKDETKFVYSTGTWTSESEDYSLRLVDAKTGKEKILLESKNICLLAKEWKDENTLFIEQFGLYGQKANLEFDLNSNEIISEATVTPFP